MSEVLETKEIEGYTINVYQDEDAENPREAWENSTTMMCAHGRYNLGDEDIKKDYNIDDYDGWDELSDAIVKDKGFIASLPLYLYDHSGITISTEPFSCRFDSGKVGVIGITREQMKELFGWNNLSKSRIEKLHKVMVSDVKVYDKYLSGDVYTYDIKKGDEVIDSCCGFYEDDSGAVMNIATDECSSLIEQEKEREVNSWAPSI